MAVFFALFSFGEIEKRERNCYRKKKLFGVEKKKKDE